MKRLLLGAFAVIAFGLTSCLTTGIATAQITLMDPSTSDGSFEDAPGADNVGSNSWNDIGSQSFWSLNRSLGPNGNPDPHEGVFSGVTNPGGRAAIESDPIPIDLSNGDIFSITGYFGTNQSGGVTSDYSIGLRFNDAKSTQIDLGLTSNTGADAGAFTVSGADSNVTGLRRISLTTEPNPNRWLEFGHSVTYDGGAATEVTVVFEARTGGGQTYWDDFTLVQTESEPVDGIVLLDRVTNDGSFEAAPGADNIGSDFWLDVGSQPFWSLNRSLGPAGVPQDGMFSGVTNPGGLSISCLCH